MAKAGRAGKAGKAGKAGAAGKAGKAQGAVRATRDAGVLAQKIDRPVSLKLTAPEYQLVSYAASKTRARGINAWMREAVVEAARHSAGKEMSEDILSGRGTVRLLKESLAEARAAQKRG